MADIIDDIHVIERKLYLDYGFSMDQLKRLAKDLSQMK